MIGALDSDWTQKSPKKRSVYDGNYAVNEEWGKRNKERGMRNEDEE